MARRRKRVRGSVLAALFLVAAAAAFLWWAGGPPSPTPAVIGGGMADDGSEMVRREGMLVVRGNPGWNLLSAAERGRAATPLSGEARAWLKEWSPTVRNVAGDFDLSPVALGGIVAAEKTLLTGRVDIVGEDLFRAVFGSLREEDLERWVADQESAFQHELGAGNPPAQWSPVRDPYLWTLGPAQVSFRLAIQNEPDLAARLDRDRRKASEVLQAVTSTPGNLEYAAELLADAQQAYGQVAGMDISGNPGVLATLYHLGAPAVRARRLAAENAARREREAPIEPPHVNYYGAFVNRNAGEIAALLGVTGRRAEGP